jgi:hypothetical protein
MLMPFQTPGNIAIFWESTERALWPLTTSLWLATPANYAAAAQIEILMHRRKPRSKLVFRHSFDIRHSDFVIHQ